MGCKFGFYEENAGGVTLRNVGYRYWTPDFSYTPTSGISLALRGYCIVDMHCSCCIASNGWMWTVVQYFNVH
jgi:hypothetical protein